MLSDHETPATAEQRVYRALRDDVVAGLLLPGQPLGEGVVAAHYGASRTPARQALRRLQYEGLVTTHPHRGTVVREITARDVVEIFDLRKALEGFAVRTAGRRLDADALRGLEKAYEKHDEASDTSSPEVFHWGADTKLHQLIIRAASNARFEAVLDVHTLQLARLHAIFWRMADDQVDAVLAASRRDAAREHRELIEVLLGGHFNTAHDLLLEHLQRGSDATVRLVSTIPVGARLGEPELLPEHLRSLSQWSA